MKEQLKISVFSSILVGLSLIFSVSAANADIPLHKWTSSSEEPTEISKATNGRALSGVEVDESGALKLTSPENLTTWIFEDGTFIPMAKLQGFKSYSIITDHLGTPVESYDEEGKKVWSRELNIYGETRKEFGEENFIPFLYQGQYLDVETELAYNRFRYYSVDSGTYISQDPIRLNGNNPNFYAYVGDVNCWIDVFGLDTIRLRHYTDNKGLAGIQDDMVIKAYDQNTVFAESASKKPLSSTDAATKYHIKGSTGRVHRGNARNYIEFEVDSSKVSKIKNSITGATEYVIKGDVELDKDTTKFVKRCK